MKTTVAARVEDGELAKLDRLARRAGLTRSQALRALVSACEHFEPARAAAVIFNSNGAEVSQAHGAVAA